MKYNKIILIVLTLLLLLFSVSSISAADLTVKSNTTNKDISDWMNSKTTVKGNNLIFDVSSYELNDTIKVTKPVNIKSNKNTNINFRKGNIMFYVTTSGITFSGLTLNNYGKGVSDLSSLSILGNSSSNTINFKKMTFNLNNDYQIAIVAKNLKGNITDSVFNIKKDVNAALTCDNFNGNIKNSSIKLTGYSSCGILIFSKWTGSIYGSNLSISRGGSVLIFVKNWIGSTYKSSISMKGNLNMGIYANYLKGSIRDTKISSSGGSAIGLLSSKWVGGMYNSKITLSSAYSTGICVNGTWKGTISKSKVYTNAKGSYGVYIFSPKSKGTISKSTVSAKKGVAISIPRSIKVKATKTAAKNKASKIYILGPKLAIGSIIYSYANYILDFIGDKGNRYFTIEIYNKGEYASKTATLTITASGYKKVVKISGIKADYYKEVSVALPQRLASTKYTKYAKITYYDGNKKKITTKARKFY